MEKPQITKNEALDKLVKAAAEATTSITLAAQELKIFNLEQELDKVKKLYEEQRLIALDASLETAKLKKAIKILKEQISLQHKTIGRITDEGKHEIKELYVVCQYYNAPNLSKEQYKLISEVLSNV